MAQIQQSQIAKASANWLEQLPFTASYASVSGSGSANAGNQAAVFALQNWTSATTPGTYVELTEAGATPQAGLDLVINSDRNQIRPDLGGWPGALYPVPLRHGGVRNLSATLVNTTTGDLVNQQLNYLVTVFRMPVAVKVLRGYALTPQEKAWATQMGVSTDAANSRGTLPIPWETIIAGTYRNRQLDPTWQYSDTVAATTSAVPFHHAQAGPNQLLILRRVSAQANYSQGVTITVDRDSDTGYLSLDASAVGASGLPMLVPARDHLTFSLSATTAPNGPVPIRIEIWTVALSNVLRVRLGLMTEADLAEAMKSPAKAQHLYAMIQTGRV